MPASCRVTQETRGAEFLTLKMCRKSKSRISQTRTSQQSLADAEEMLETCPFLPSSANQSSRPLQRSRSKPPASSLLIEFVCFWQVQARSRRTSSRRWVPALSRVAWGRALPSGGAAAFRPGARLARRGVPLAGVLGLSDTRSLPLPLAGVEGDLEPPWGEEVGLL